MFIGERGSFYKSLARRNFFSLEIRREPGRAALIGGTPEPDWPDYKPALGWKQDFEERANGRLGREP